METFTSCSLLTRGPSDDERETELRAQNSRCVLSLLQPALTLSGGAPAGDGACPGQRQRTHPDVDGSDKLVENQLLLQLQQSHVALFSPTVVAEMGDDPGDADQLKKTERRQETLVITCYYAKLHDSLCYRRVTKCFVVK